MIKPPPKKTEHEEPLLIVFKQNGFLREGPMGGTIIEIAWPVSIKISKPRDGGRRDCSQNIWLPSAHVCRQPFLKNRRQNLRVYITPQVLHVALLKEIVSCQRATYCAVLNRKEKMNLNNGIYDTKPRNNSLPVLTNRVSGRIENAFALVISEIGHPFVLAALEPETWHTSLLTICFPYYILVAFNYSLHVVVLFTSESFPFHILPFFIPISLFSSLRYSRQFLCSPLFPVPFNSLLRSLARYFHFPTRFTFIVFSLFTFLFFSSLFFYSQGIKSDQLCCFQSVSWGGLPLKGGRIN